MAMKNATAYQRKIKKLLSKARRCRIDPADTEDAIGFLLLSMLEAEATRRQASHALSAIRQRFVDYNEIRVAAHKEIQECFAKGLADGHERADTLIRVLNGVFDRTCQMSLEHLAKTPKRELRKSLLGLGLSPYSAARLILWVFGGHAVPVDRALAETLEMDGYVAPGTSLEDVQGFLERIVAQKDAPGVHNHLRAYVEQRAEALARKRKKDAREAARQRARLEAEAKKLAEEEAKKRAEEEAKRAEAEKARKAAARRARKKKPGKKATERKAARKPAKRARRKTTRKPRRR
ncbi:MAG TPA: hypothetical protein VNA25_13935 [Phycisphaerae bacterium]|nr:hypothetical protein [Phycisphaerae bacterium]